MEDLFSRLYARAGTENQRPLENFTTEALALATDADPRPMLEAIRRIEWFRQAPPPPLGDRSAVSTRTQVPLTVGTSKAPRWLDLVLTIDDDAMRQEYWAEVKAEADVSGDQLVAYERERGTRGAHLISISVRPLVMVAADPESRVPWLSWESIAASVDVTPDAHGLWRALQAFLREKELAPRAGATQASIPPDGDKVLRYVNDRIETTWVDSPLAWHAPTQMITTAREAAQRLHRFATTGGPLEYGYEAGGWFLAVRATNFQRVKVDVMGMLAVAEGAGLGADWVRSRSGVDPILVARLDDPGASLPLDRITGWYGARIDELRSAGVLDAWLEAWRQRRNG